MTAAVTVILVVAGAVFAGFALLLLHAAREIKAWPAQLAALACPACGVLIGLDAANLIAARRQEELQRLHADARHRRVILRISPYWRFACPACTAALQFDPGAREQKLTVDGDATSRTSARPAPP